MVNNTNKRTHTKHNNNKTNGGASTTMAKKRRVQNNIADALTRALTILDVKGAFLGFLKGTKKVRNVAKRKIAATRTATSRRSGKTNTTTTTTKNNNKNKNNNK